MNNQQIKVWDISIRIFHWSLLLFFFIAYISGEEEDLIHIYSGYIICGLLVYRFIWGFIGTKHARFRDFIFGPKIVAEYTRSLFTKNPKHYLGHNPLGGWMVIALLLSLTGVSWTGLELYATEGHGPLATQQINIISSALADDDDDDDQHENEEHDRKANGEDFWEELHEFFANFTLFLVFFHVAGIFIGTIIHKESLVKAMITGFKTGQGK